MSERLSCKAATLGAILLAATSAGCAREVPQPPAEDSTATNASGASPVHSAPAEFKLRPVDRAQYDEVIAGLKGQVVLVDFWATWCSPCVSQFPHTVDLANQFSDQGLAVVTVSFDDPGDPSAPAAFLRQRGAGKLTNLLNQYGLGPEAMEAFEIEGGALPSYKLYDRSGQLRKTFESDPSAEKQFSPQDIDAAIEELLAEQSR